MFKGYKVKIDKTRRLDHVDEFEEYGWILRGEEYLENPTAQFGEYLEYELNETNNYYVINVNKLNEKAMPFLDSDVFICHSRDDKELAAYIAGMLSAQLNLNVFIDSSAWIYKDEIRKEIQGKMKIVDQEKLFRLEANISNILLSALFKMIHHCPIFLFIDTDNSLYDRIISQSTTLSPWIASELQFSSLVRTNSRNISESITEKSHTTYMVSPDYVFEHPATTNHLKEVRLSQIMEWCKGVQIIDRTEGLNKFIERFS